jgi:hypothetical protein
MVRLIVYSKLTPEDALKLIRDMIEWFEANPKRRVCNTDLFKVRRGFIAKDVLEHTEP